MTDDRPKSFGQGAQIFKKKARPIADRIKRQAESLSNQTPYQTFGLNPGCGQAVVRETYYDLLKVYHPDAWGKLDRASDKLLAQDLFFAFKGQFESLLTLEELREAKQKRTPTRSVGDSFSSIELDPITQELTGLSQASDELSEEERRDRLQRLLKRSAQSKLKQTYNKLRETYDHQPPQPDLSATLDPKTRQAHLDRLEERKEQIKQPAEASALDPIQASPSQEIFNRAYLAFKDHHYRRSLELFEEAHKMEPENGLFTTYYAYTLFLTDAEQKQTSLTLLRAVIDSGDRQALSDAYLFAGYIYKTIDGKENRAIKFFRKAVEQNPYNHDAARAVRLEERRAKQKQSTLGGQLLSPWRNKK